MKDHGLQNIVAITEAADAVMAEIIRSFVAWYADVCRVRGILFIFALAHDGDVNAGGWASIVEADCAVDGSATLQADIDRCSLVCLDIDLWDHWWLSGRCRRLRLVDVFSVGTRREITGRRGHHIVRARRDIWDYEAPVECSLHNAADRSVGGRRGVASGSLFSILD